MKCKEGIVNLNQILNFRQKDQKVINSWLDSLIYLQWSRQNVETFLEIEFYFKNENGVSTNPFYLGVIGSPQNLVILIKC